MEPGGMALTQASSNCKELSPSDGPEQANRSRQAAHVRMNFMIDLNTAPAD